jgi:hypothetical protein
MIQNTQFTTVTCDFPECGKTATFEVTQAGIHNDIVEANPWLKTNLIIQTVDKRTFSLCSTLCLVKAAQTGIFDPVEVKTIETAPGGIAAIAAAAAENRRKQLADKNIREGQPVQVALA